MTCGCLICLGLSKLVRRLGPRPRPLPWAPVNEVPHHRAFRLAHVPRGAEDSPRKLHGAVIAGGEQLISERGESLIETFQHYVFVIVKGKDQCSVVRMKLGCPRDGLERDTASADRVELGKYFGSIGASVFRAKHEAPPCNVRGESSLEFRVVPVFGARVVE